MNHSILLTLGAAVLVGMGTLVFQNMAKAEGPDCPGQITCSQTGELICRDQCPLNPAPEVPAVDPCRPISR